MRVAVSSNYPPRVCGIGSLAFDLCTALVEVEGTEDVGALVVVDEGTGDQRPEVLSTVREAARGDHIEAAGGGPGGALGADQDRRRHPVPSHPPRLARHLTPREQDRRAGHRLASRELFDVYYGMGDDRIGVARLDVPALLPPGAVADPPAVTRTGGPSS